MRKVWIVMTTEPGDNEQSGASPITVDASGNSRTYGEFARFEDAIFLLNVSAASGESPTLDIKIQGWDESIGDWRDALTFEQITTAVGKVEPETLTLYYKWYRAVWTVGGTNPEFTFSLAAIARAT